MSSYRLSDIVYETTCQKYFVLKRRIGANEYFCVYKSDFISHYASKVATISTSFGLNRAIAEVNRRLESDKV
jgi:hypothetical protein